MTGSFNSKLKKLMPSSENISQKDVDRLSPLFFDGISKDGKHELRLTVNHVMSTTTLTMSVLYVYAQGVGNTFQLVRDQIHV